MKRAVPEERAAPESRPRRIHLVEPAGYGGPYQHAVAVADLLGRAGHPVVVHTATDRECDTPHARFCLCTNWYRNLNPRSLRLPVLASAYLLRTLPHLLRQMEPNDVMHFEGAFRMPLTQLTLVAVHRLRCPVVFSPHNIFSRRGSRIEEWMLRLSVQRVGMTIVYSEVDARRVAALGGRALVTGLVQYMPPPDEALVRRWRQRWAAGAGRKVVLFPGQVRPDKRLDLLIEAAHRWSGDHVLAVAGADEGGVTPNQELARDLGVEVRWDIRCLPFDEFVAAIRAADVVVCPHERASQSGVLSLARQLGVTSVARDTGGLAELATIAVGGEDPQLLADAIDRALMLSPPDPTGIAGGDEVVTTHLLAYTLAHGVNGSRGACGSGRAP